MTANWIHIIIVHLAVIITPWLAIRVIFDRKKELDSISWKRNYSALILLTIITAIAYFTGPETADWTKDVLDSFPQDRVEDHALWGRVAFVIQVITGLLAIMAWASILQEEKPAGIITKVLMILLIINTFIIVYTAHLGGFIRRMDLMF